LLGLIIYDDYELQMTIKVRNCIISELSAQQIKKLKFELLSFVGF